MRTVVTLDPDVEALLKHAIHTSGKTLEQVVNDAVRQALSGSTTSTTVFQQRSFAMGRPRVDLTKALALAGQLDDLDTLAHYPIHNH